MSYLPMWARKPRHKEEVVATSRGWMVKRTGEYLRMVRNLDQKLRLLHSQMGAAINSIVEDEPEPVVVVVEPEVTPEPVVEPEVEATPEPVIEPEPEVEPEPAPKRRGRPRKNAAKTADKK